MSPKTTRIITLSILFMQILMLISLPTAIAQDSGDDENTKDFWDQYKPYILSTILLFLFASVNYAIKLFRKDKILKKLLKKYVVFEMDDKKTRYRGTMRLEANGLEIISEESRQRGHAPSYIFTDKEAQGIIAYIRYLDSMNERERLERDWELDNAYHPRLPARLRRKLRNFGVALSDSVNKTFEMIWGGIKKTRAFKAVSTEGEAATEVEEAKKQLWEYAQDERYERLIERLVGTRVKVKANTGEYIGVLREYSDKYMVLMDVRDADGNGYKDDWGYTREINGLNYRDDRGLRCKIEGDEIVFENNAPYDILLGDLVLKEDSPDFKQEFKYETRIPGFATMRFKLEPGPVAQKIAPFEQVVTRKPRTLRNFKKIELHFRSYREADVVFPRSACKIVESAEKYQPEQLALGGLTEALLAAKQKEADIEFIDSNGNPIRGINIVHGYITNVNEERIDIKAVDHSYGRRWSVEHAFQRFDDKLRKVGRLPIQASPLHRSRMASQTYLVNKAKDKKPEQDAMSPLLYTPVSPQIKAYRRRQLPIKVLALTGNVTEAEFPVLQRFKSIREHHLIYEPVKHLQTDEIARTHLLWLGHGEIYKEGYRLSIDDEHRIKDFVRRGGIAIVSGQDVRDIQKRRRGIGWIPEPLLGVEHDETLEFTPTSRGRKAGIFKAPHKIQSGQIKLDDMWRDDMGKYALLATANGGDDAALLMLQFQEGLYIITSLKNEKPEDAHLNQAMMENLLYFSVKWLDRHKHEKLYYTHA